MIRVVWISRKILAYFKVFQHSCWKVDNWHVLGMKKKEKDNKMLILVNLHYFTRFQLIVQSGVKTKSVTEQINLTWFWSDKPFSHFFVLLYLFIIFFLRAQFWCPFFENMSFLWCFCICSLRASDTSNCQEYIQKLVYNTYLLLVVCTCTWFEKFLHNCYYLCLLPRLNFFPTFFCEKLS